VLAFKAIKLQSYFLLEIAMAKQNLASLSVDALLKLRNDIGSVLSRKADDLKRELASLGADYAGVGRGTYGKKRKSLAGRKVAPKYRDPRSKMTWAGRGARPVWMREALKDGKKPEDFLISKPAKKTRRKKK
jgi:DNA-binding protein H-NS